MRRNFIERVDGFLVFKTGDYHDVLKEYDEKRLELATLQRKKTPDHRHRSPQRNAYIIEVLWAST